MLRGCIVVLFAPFLDGLWIHSIFLLCINSSLNTIEIINVNKINSFSVLMVKMEVLLA